MAQAEIFEAAKVETQSAAPARSGTFTRLQSVMIAHGVLILFMSLVAGLGLWMKLMGGFEFIPGTVTAFDIPGTAEGWAKAHRGTPMNALMVITVALILPHLGFGRKLQNWLAVIMVGAGWANTIFYFFANFSDNRGLTFGSNVFGPGSIASFIALAPAYAFGVASMGATLYMAWRIFSRRD
ncbi:styrene-oxide isomerase StyC [Oleomonas cavernae]|nr:hypothetical protein [Oleomonas cavernae]